MWYLPPPPDPQDEPVFLFFSDRSSGLGLQRVRLADQGAGTGGLGLRHPGPGRAPGQDLPIQRQRVGPWGRRSSPPPRPWGWIRSKAEKNYPKKKIDFFRDDIFFMLTCTVSKKESIIFILAGIIKTCWCEKTSFGSSSSNKVGCRFFSRKHIWKTRKSLSRVMFLTPTCLF